MQLKELKTSFLGRTALFYNKIDSTQSKIWRMIKNENIKNGTLIIANIQTKAQGTHGRIWHTDEINNIAFSTYIKTDCNIKAIEGITIEIAKILVNVFEEEYNIKLDIKVPNDIMVNGKKIGGILTQSKINAEKVKYIIIGIGINTLKMNFTEDIKDLATSIKKEFEIEVDNIKIISEFCNKFEKFIIDRKIVLNDRNSI